MSAQWDAEVTIDEPLVRRLLQSQYPEFADGPVRLLGEGWDCSAWLAGDDWVFRLPRRQAGADCLENEIRVLPEIVGRLPSMISAPELIGQSGESFPWPFAACRLVPGVSLCDAGVDDGQRNEIASQLGGFLKRLHAIDSAEARRLGAPEDEYERLDVATRSEKSEQLLSQAANGGLISRNLASGMRRVIDSVVHADPQPTIRSLVHGDLYARHVMTESGRITGIIDWGDVHLGDPAADLAAAWAMFSPESRDIFFKEYGPVSTETRELAILRAIGHGLNCLIYAHEVRDLALSREAYASLQRLAAQ